MDQRPPVTTATTTPSGGIFILDKATGRSSAGAADDVRKCFLREGMDLRCGHGGTLDPFATGVLAVCLGQATKVAPYLLADDKAYEADIHFGVETDTLDRTGTITRTLDATFDLAALRAAATARLGEQDQIPPMHSAIKQGGVRLYHLARRGEEVVRPSRRVRIDRFDVSSYEPPIARVAIACSKGTYIRSLVADLGTDLGTCAHLAELRRTRSGVLHLADGLHIDRVRELSRDELVARLIPLAGVTGLTSVTFPNAMIGQIQNGLQVPAEMFGAAHLERFQLVDESGLLHAVVHVDPTDKRVVYDRVFRP